MKSSSLRLLQSISCVYTWTDCSKSKAVAIYLKTVVDCLILCVKHITYLVIIVVESWVLFVSPGFSKYFFFLNIALILSFLFQIVLICITAVKENLILAFMVIQPARGKKNHTNLWMRLFPLW